jgi:hydroxyacylglutathione hydrolase
MQSRAKFIWCLLVAIVPVTSLSLSLPAQSLSSQIVPGTLDVHWNAGAKDCKQIPQPPLQVHAYNPQTFILRENLCSTFEAPFIFLLVGSSKALLIDTGDVSDPKQMPLAETVLSLIPTVGNAKLPLLVVHTHLDAGRRF